MHVAAVIKRKGSDVVTLAAEQTIAEAVNVLTERRIGALLVMDGNDAVGGIISERDIVRHLARHGAALEAPVEAIMTHEVHTCSSQETVARAMALMTRFRYRHLPVVDDGRLVGIISIGDLVKHRVYEMELETGVLRDRVIARH